MGEMTEEIHPRNGVVPRVIEGIWKRIVEADDNYEFELKVSFLEIYNEQIFDLLSSDNHSRGKRKKKKKTKKINYSTT